MLCEGPVEATGTKLLLRMDGLSDQLNLSRSGAEQLLQELSWSAVNLEAAVEFLSSLQALFSMVKLSGLVLWAFGPETSWEKL